MISRYAISMFSFSKKIYRSLPRRLRDVISPTAYFLFDLMNSLRPEVWNVTGELRNCQLPLSMCLFTRTDRFRSYISTLIFGSSASTRYLGRTWFWNTRKLSKGTEGASLVFCEIDPRCTKLLWEERGLSIPAWILGEAALPRSPRELNRKSAQYARRKIEQNSLEFEITHDQKRFDDFYDSMFVPYIKLRHGGSAYIVPRNLAQKDFDQGELVLVKQKGECISGLITTYEGSSVNLLKAGVRDGNWNYVRDGALVAAYEFALRHAEEKGCRKVNFNRSRAFLKDGVLKFKREMSQRIVGADRQMYMLRILRDSQVARLLLENMPFIFEHLGGFHGAVFVQDEITLAVQTLREIRKQYYHPGMKDLIVFQFSSCLPANEEEFVPAPLPGLPIMIPTEPTDPFEYKQLPRAEWMELIQGLGCVGIENAIAIYPRDTNRIVNSQIEAE